VPLVDHALLRTISPALPTLAPGSGKVALAAAPARPLPDKIVARAKTGFGVPTGAWMAIAATETTGPSSAPKGLISRRWSQTVLQACAA